MRHLLVSGFLCALLAVPAVAQFENGEVLGTVRDETGSVVAKAAITLNNQDTNITAKTVTDDSGNYLFPNVKVGRYTVTAELAGFSKASAADVTVDVGARQRVDLALKVGAITDTVEVTGAASALETDSSDHGQVISSAAVAALPLNGRNYADLALLSTNTIKSPIAASFSPSGTPRGFRPAAHLAKVRSTSMECAAPTTIFFSTAWTTTPTAPAIRAIRRKSSNRHRTRSRNSK